MIFLIFSLWLIILSSKIDLIFMLSSSSVTQSCPTRDPMDCSMPGFPVHHQLLKLAQLMSIESVIPSNHLILCHPLLSCLQSFAASGRSFPMSQFFSLRGQSIGASALVNIQDWFPLGLTSLMSLQSKGLSRVFSSTTFQRH